MASDKGKKSAKTVTAIPANDDGTEKKRALDIALAGIEKQFGKGAVIRMGERAVRDIQVIPTGCLDLDMALGVGGVPRGRVVEIYGPESSGKTTVALHIVAEAQKMGGVAAFIDAEHALDPVYARKLGVDVDQLYVSQPDTGEQALEICEALVRSGAIDVVVIDSVAALVPKAEIDGEMGDSFVGLQARLMSQALRKLTGIINKTNSTCIFINQLREKVGVMYGNPETTPGGRALKFYASPCASTSAAASSSRTAQPSSATARRRRSSRTRSRRRSEPRSSIFYYGEGISKEGSLLDSAVALDIIHKSGAWFSFGDQRIGQAAAKDPQAPQGEARKSPEIDKLVRAELMGKDAPVVQSAADDDERPTDDGMDDLPNLDDEE